MVKEYTNGDETLFMYEQTDKTDRHGTGDVFFESYGSIIVSKKKVEQHFETSLSLSFSLFLFFFWRRFFFFFFFFVVWSFPFFFFGVVVVGGGGGVPF